MGDLVRAVVDARVARPIPLIIRQDGCMLQLRCAVEEVRMKMKLLLLACLLLLIVVLVLPGSADAASPSGGGFWYLVKRGDTLVGHVDGVGELTIHYAK